MLGRRSRLGSVLLALFLLGSAALPGAFAVTHVQTRAAVAIPTQPLTGGISGPSSLGTGLRGTYEVTATGGPAESPNGSQTGVYSYHASLAGNDLSNSTAITPSAGVLVNGSVNLTLIAPNASQEITIFVLVTSSQGANNVSQNFSKAVNIVLPYRLSATLVAGSGASVAPFNLTVLLDGAPVGTIAVALISPGGSLPISFSYVNTTLAPGWHTFSISLAIEHGLVAFAGGAQEYTASFYVPGPSPDYTFWYILGGAALVGAIFIWSSRVAARRRPKTKK